MDAMSGVVRAGGKVILFGEHGVVYGKRALAAGLGTGARAEYDSANTPRLSIEPWGVTVEPRSGDENAIAHAQLAQAFGALLSAYDSPPALHIHVTMELPSGAGLGGSAALCVAIVRALDASLGINRAPHEIAEIAMRAERV